MKRINIVVVLFTVAWSLEACNKQSDRSAAATNQPQSSAASPVAAVSISQRTSDTTAAVAEDVSFLNQHFVNEDNECPEPTGFRADGGRIFFEFNCTYSGKKLHFVRSASAAALDPDSVRTEGACYHKLDPHVVDSGDVKAMQEQLAQPLTSCAHLWVSCRNQRNCISGPRGTDKSFIVGPVDQAHAEEAKQHLKRILLSLKDSPAPKVPDAPTEKETAGVADNIKIVSVKWKGPTDGTWLPTFVVRNNGATVNDAEIDYQVFDGEVLVGSSKLDFVNGIPSNTTARQEGIPFDSESQPKIKVVQIMAR